MQFGWISGINAAVILILVIINIIAAKKELCVDLKSKRFTVNLLEQAGRYGCMFFMILPFLTQNREFAFGSAAAMFAWLGLAGLLLSVYIILWMKKRGGGTGILYGLTAIPAVLFLINGILLCHPILITAALLFGAAHLMIVRENHKPGSGGR